MKAVSAFENLDSMSISEARDIFQVAFKHACDSLLHISKTSKKECISDLTYHRLYEVINKKLKLEENDQRPS